jgi:alcohol dehydrogenase class IV
VSTFPDALTLPPSIVSGSGCVTRVPAACAAFGARGLLVHGRSVASSRMLQRILSSAPPGMRVETWQHPGDEPALDQLAELLTAARRMDVSWIAGVGGGSTLDLAKACAGLLRAPLSPVDYHNGAALPASETPFVAAPTTAGTGTEATFVCVLTNRDGGVKKSFRHPTLMPRIVFLDPDLLLGCPPPVIASSGMDAFTQAFESFLSKGATAVTDDLALRALAGVLEDLDPVYRGSSGDSALRLLQASCLAGMALCNARLGLVHGLAHPLGAFHHAPHGLVCAACLPEVIEFNRPACQAKYGIFRHRFGADPAEISGRLLASLSIRSPFAGRPRPDTGQIVMETLASGSTASNPRPVSAADVEAILTRLYA